MPSWASGVVAAAAIAWRGVLVGLGLVEVDLGVERSLPEAPWRPPSRASPW